MPILLCASVVAIIAMFGQRIALPTAAALRELPGAIRYHLSFHRARRRTGLARVRAAAFAKKRIRVFKGPLFVPFWYVSAVLWLAVGVIVIFSTAAPVRSASR